MNHLIYFVLPAIFLWGGSLIAQDPTALPTPNQDVAAPVLIGPPAPSVEGVEAPAATPSKAETQIDRYTVRLGADTSLGEPMKIVSKAWADSGEGDGSVQITLGPSGEILQKVILNKEVFDVVILAESTAIDQAVADGHLLNTGRSTMTLAKMTLLGRKPLIAAEGLNWRQLLEREWRRIGYANPKNEPSGIVAQALLTELGLIRNSIASAKVVQAPNEQQLLAKVRRGELDAMLALDVNLAHETVSGCQVYDMTAVLPPKTPLRLGFSILHTASRQRLQAKMDFQSLLTSDAMQIVLKNYGFEKPE